MQKNFAATLARAATVALGVAMTLAACGGGSNTDSGGDCSVASQKEFVLDATRALYLFPETLPAMVDPASHPDAQSLLDWLTATARGQGRDRYFSYVTTVDEDVQYFDEGTYVGYGFGLTFTTSSASTAELRLRYTFDGSPAATAGMRRGDTITAIDSGAGFQTVRSLLIASGSDGVDAALGPATAGTQRGFRWTDASGGAHEARITQRLVTMTPVPANGVKVLTATGGTKVGYVQLLSFINPAQMPLINAFQQFRTQGVTQMIVDLRYNGGGVINIAEILANQLARNRSSADVMYTQQFSSSNTRYNEVAYFSPRTESVPATRIAFITSRSSASASELVVNVLKPYAQVAIIGENTYGKPVGQIGLEMDGDCGVLLRLIAFKLVNALNQGDYYSGLASTLPAGSACAANDDLLKPYGEISESATAAAMNWLSSSSCPSPISSAATVEARSAGRLSPLSARPGPLGEYLPDAR